LTGGGADGHAQENPGLRSEAVNRNAAPAEHRKPRITASRSNRITEAFATSPFHRRREQERLNDARESGIPWKT